MLNSAARHAGWTLGAWERDTLGMLRFWRRGGEFILAARIGVSDGVATVAWWMAPGGAGHVVTVKGKTIGEAIRAVDASIACDMAH